MKSARSATAVLAAVVAVLAAGCANSPDRYYTLAEPVAEAPSSTAPASPASPAGAVVGATGPAPATGTFIDIAPVAMPERLARPQLVVSRGGASTAEVALLEQHRWTSSFENELRDALGGGVASRLGAFDATKGGRQNSVPVWRIAVQVRQFDATEGARVDGAFGWTIKRSDATLATTCQLALSEPVGAGIDSVAQGARRVVANAAAAIARSVTAAQANPAGPCAL